MAIETFEETPLTEEQLEVAGKQLGNDDPTGTVESIENTQHFIDEAIATDATYKRMQEDAVANTIIQIDAKVEDLDEEFPLKSPHFKELFPDPSPEEEPKGFPLTDVLQETGDINSWRVWEPVNGTITSLGIGHTEGPVVAGFKDSTKNFLDNEFDNFTVLFHTGAEAGNTFIISETISPDELSIGSGSYSEGDFYVILNSQGAVVFSPTVNFDPIADLIAKEIKKFSDRWKSFREGRFHEFFGINGDLEALQAGLTHMEAELEFQENRDATYEELEIPLIPPEGSDPAGDTDLGADQEGVEAGEDTEPPPEEPVEI